jgi:formate hydrogenlyase transcriptional activator
MLERLDKIGMTAALGKALLFVVLLVAWPTLSPAVASAAESPKRVLIFSSEDQHVPAITLLNQAIRSTMKNGLPVGVQFFYEAQDNFRISNDKYEEEFVRLLQRKYDGEHIDLIYVLGPPAVRFLLKHQGELFSDTPVVFIVQDQNRLPDLNLGPHIAVVSGKIELSPTLDIALSLHPQTQRVVVVAGKTSADTALVELAHREFRPYEGKVEFTYLTGLPIEELQNKLAGLPDKSIVFYLSVQSDNAARNYNSPEVVSLLAQSSSAPIYGAAQTYMGTGIIGGRLIDYEAIGTLAAQTGLRILAGESPQNIPTQIVPSTTMFDWRELRRWGISEGNLPPGSVVRFKELTFWELYKWRIVGVISLCILEAVLIVLLLVSRARRRQAERASKASAAQAEAERRHLDEVVSNVPGIVWESRLEPDASTRKTQFVSEYVEKMLGYSVEEWITTPGFWLTIIPEEDRARATRESEAIFASGREGALQFRWVAKDGRVLWVEAHLAAVCDETGKAIGLRGVTMNITDRKSAEEALRESEHRFQLVSQATKDIIYDWNLQTGFVWWNDSAMRSVFGYTLEEMRHDVNWWEERLHPEDKDRINVSVSEALGGVDQMWENEYRFRKMDNSYAYVYHRAFIVRGEGGQALKVIGSLMDFTDRKQAEENLHRTLEEVSRLKNQLQEENIYLQEEIKLAHNFDEIVGHSDAIKYVLYKIEQVAPTDSTVLITGETGTGKELVARAIHSTGRRRDRPLVKVNCAALSASLIESELFGHERGAFTGAASRKIGRFELATGATIFLDEIGELPLELQVKLLRVIQEGEFERLGSSKTIKADVRIIAATNRNLQTEVQNGHFREDLFYRLNVFPITVPPLKQRREDIALLIEHFAMRFSKRLGKEITSVSPATLKTLRDYSWPGNIRELANVIERAVINTQGSVLRVVDHFEPAQAEESQRKTLEEMEREYITGILNEAEWRIEGPNGAARILGLNPSTLRTRMAKLGIQKPNHNLVSASERR